MSEPLALEGPGSSSSIIDALAYVDSMSAAEKQAAEALVDKEMQAMRRGGQRMDNYVEHLRPLSSFLKFEGNEIMQSEMARIDQGQRHMAPLDMSATKLETPRLHQQDDLPAWQASASNAAAQLEHQHNRVTNLQLGAKHGAPVWKAHNAHTEALLKHCERRLHQTEERITKINQRRKLQQEKARAELERYASAYRRVLKKNVEIEVACRRLESEIESSGGDLGIKVAGEDGASENAHVDGTTANGAARAVAGGDARGADSAGEAAAGADTMNTD